MSAAHAPGSLPATQVLRCAEEEAAALAKLLRGLEEAVCDVLARDGTLSRDERAAQLQAFDLRGRRLYGLAGCLGVLAGTLDAAVEVPAQSLFGVILLEWQRTALLVGVQAGAETASRGPDIF